MAWREAFKHFTGRYVLTADDDDPILSDAIEIHEKNWRQLESQDNYEEFWEVRTRCQTPDGRLVGPILSEPSIDSNHIEFTITLGIKAEMHASRKVEILCQEAGIPPFLFEEKCSNFQESIRWIRAGKKYKTRYVSAVTRIYIPNPSGLIKGARSNRTLYNSFVYAIYMLRENRDIILKNSIKDYIMLLITIAHRSVQLNEGLDQLGLKKCDYILVSFLKQGVAMYKKIISY